MTEGENKNFKPINAEWNFPPLLIVPIHFRFKGCWVVFFIFIQIFKETSVTSKQCKPDQMPPFAASGLVLHCLPMSHKNDARLIWVNRTYTNMEIGR